MITGRIIGEIIGTIKHPFYEKHKLLAVEKIDFAGKPGDMMVAIDTVDAGVGDIVLVNDEGNGASQVVNDNSAPLRSVIVGVVDELNVVEHSALHLNE